MGQVSSLTQFVAGTKAISSEVNSNFEALRVGHNATDSITTSTKTKVDNLNIVNVKDYGAIGDGIADDTNAIRAAIHAVSPICTDATGQTLASFTAGVDSFSTSNAYRYGGIVYLPRGTYKTTADIYINYGVQLVGEGRSSYGFISTSAPNGTIIDFQPSVVTDKIAFDMVGFKKSTGQRIPSDSTDLIQGWANYDAGNISSVRGAKISNMTINCKTGVLCGIRMVGVSGGNVLDNVAITGQPLVALIMSACLSGSSRSVQGQASTQGLIAYAVNAWDFSGGLSLDQNGTKSTFVWTYPDSGGADKDYHTTYSTAIYGAYLNQVNFGTSIIEGWDRSYFLAHGYGLSIAHDYQENITNICYNLLQGSYLITEPFISATNATLFKLQNIKPITQKRQVRLIGGTITATKIIDTTFDDASIGNEAGALLVDMSKYAIESLIEGVNGKVRVTAGVELKPYTIDTDIVSIYVDYLTGNDTYWSYTDGTPVKTLNKAFALCKKGKQNIIYLKNGQLHTSESEYILITEIKVKITGTGTLTSVTGSIESGANLLTVNSATNLAIGQYISVAGAGAASAILNTYITSVSGNIITVNDNAGTTVTDAAVSWQNAIIRPYNASGYGRYITTSNANVICDTVQIIPDSTITAAGTLGVFEPRSGSNAFYFKSCNIAIPTGLGLFQTSYYGSLLDVTFETCTISGAGYIGVNANGKTCITGIKSGGTYTISNDFGTNYVVVSYTKI